MITAFGFLAGGAYLWRQPGTIVRILSAVFLGCGVLAALSLAGAL